MKRYFAALLAVALLCAFACAEEALTPGKIVSGYLSVVAGLEDGSAGYSLKLAKAACEVARFANDNVREETPELLTHFIAAWEALGADRQERFRENFLSVALTLTDAFDDYESSRALFEDAGADVEMAALTSDTDARTRTQVLLSYTALLDEELASLLVDISEA